MKGLIKLFLLTVFTSLSGTSVHAFDSGSTGVDGDLNPTADIEIPLPPDGILNYKSVHIPGGVTVTFTPNAANTPVYMLVQEDAEIYGFIDVSATDQVQAGIPVGGHGGFRGGLGGSLFQNGRAGQGPGGGAGGQPNGTPDNTCGGMSASHAVPPRMTTTNAVDGCDENLPIPTVYGSDSLIPLLGGSGGGGAYGFSNGTVNRHGGGGGGAILLAASGTITFGNNDGIRANGGDSYPMINSPPNGGGGSGGSIRLVATTIDNTTGTSSGLNILETKGGSGSLGGIHWGYGGEGRIRIEAETINALRLSNSLYYGSVTYGTPGRLFIAEVPSLKFTKIAGRDVPTNPTGADDVILPESVPNPMEVEITATDVPVGSVVQVIITSNSVSSATIVNSSPLIGTDASSTATASITLPPGQSLLTASIEFTLTDELAARLSPLAMGKAISKVQVASTIEGGSTTTFITTSGERYSWPSKIASAGIN